MTRGGKRLVWIAANFLLVGLLTRIGLAIFSGEHYVFREWGRFLGIGLVFDLAVVPCFLLPWALYEAVAPRTFQRAWLQWLERAWAGFWAVSYLVLIVVVAAAEFAFWAEFASRFDFIAVDYLIYTNEVLGNIRESYPVGLWLMVVVVTCAAIWWISWPDTRNAKRSRWLMRWGRAVVVMAAMAVGLQLADRDLADGEPNAYVQQLSMNGFFAFAHAFRHNELDYTRYYPTLARTKLEPEIRSLLRQGNAEFAGPHGIDRRITAYRPLRKVNVVLISVESLSAEFVGRFGNKAGLTPELDRIAGQGLLFTNLYATGTRTVRGLEALSIGTPPTPGQSIVRRPHNDGLENLGEELKENGWSPYWIYGGYGFFDNMNAYFGANRYEVVDRSTASAEGLTIHSENIWGIADEDLYSLAMRQFDREHAHGNRFFAHIMTTSNHRPYTFPDHRIDLPQKHREGAVKYTDWAIGDFLRRASLKPWFANTLFIITADHTAKAAGKTDLPLARYHIPMIWYGPGLVRPGIMPRLMSQVDVGPTLMGWLGLSYESRFFGYDMFVLEPGRERAFISTYQKVGYVKNGRLVVLDVNRQPVVGALPGVARTPSGAVSDQELIGEAIAWYQTASMLFGAGKLKDVPETKAAVRTGVTDGALSRAPAARSRGD